MQSGLKPNILIVILLLVINLKAMEALEERVKLLMFLDSYLSWHVIIY